MHAHTRISCILKFFFSFISYRNSDTSSNYVDRVRIRDPAKQTSSDGPGRGSGWRQKSLSNIDLTANHRANGVFRYRDFDGQLCDLYSKNSDCAEYDDLYGVNPKGKFQPCARPPKIRLNFVVFSFRRLKQKDYVRPTRSVQLTSKS